MLTAISSKSRQLVQSDCCHHIQQHQQLCCHSSELLHSNHYIAERQKTWEAFHPAAGHQNTLSSHTHGRTVPINCHSYKHSSVLMEQYEEEQGLRQSLLTAMLQPACTTAELQRMKHKQEAFLLTNECFQALSWRCIPDSTIKKTHGTHYTSISFIINNE